MFFLCFDRLLIGYKRYFVFLSIVIRFVLSNILNITSILGIRNNHAIIRLAVKVNRFLIIGIRGYLVSVSLDIIS
jgi:hypothetical protein